MFSYKKVENPVFFREPELLLISKNILFFNFYIWDEGTSIFLSFILWCPFGLTNFNYFIINMLICNCLQTNQTSTKMSSIMKHVIKVLLNDEVK